MDQILDVFEKVEKLEKNQVQFNVELAEMKSQMEQILTHFRSQNVTTEETDEYKNNKSLVPVETFGSETLNLIKKSSNFFATDLQGKMTNEIMKLKIQFSSDLHFARIEILDEIERKFNSLQIADQSIFETMLKVKEETEIKMNNLGKDFGFLFKIVTSLKNQSSEGDKSGGKALENVFPSTEKDVEMNLRVEKLQEKIEDVSKMICELKYQMETKAKTEEYCERRLLEFDFKLEKLSRKHKQCLREMGCPETEDKELARAKKSAFQRRDLNPTPDLVWRIPGVREKLSLRSFEVRSKGFALTGFPFWAQVVFRSDGFKISMLISYFDPEKSGNERLLSKVAPRVHFLLRDVSGSEDLVRSGSFNFGSTLKLDTLYNFRRFSLSTLLFLHPSYVTDDAVTMEIHVEPFHLTNRVHSRDGTLSWTIFDYRKCVEMERKELVQYQLSPYFYTAARGYRVQAVVYLNGEGDHRGQGLSVEISFKTGQFDHELASSSSSHPHFTIISIFDPGDPDKRVTKTVATDAREKNACYDLWAHELVEMFLADDSLSFQITVRAQ